MQILFVDDEELIIRSMTRSLARFPGVTVTTAMNVREAAEALGQRPFDAVVADHHLSGPERGTDVLRLAVEKCPAACRVLLTGGIYGKEDEADIAAAPVDVVLYKPVQAARMIEAIGSRAA